MESDDLISDEATKIFAWINFPLCGCIAIFGTIANVINIICFVRQGLQDPINVSFLGLSISDLGGSATLVWSCICLIPAFRESDVPFDPIELMYLMTGWPHIVFTRVTSWITALIILERCLCITVPLKVKSIVTPKRVTAIITSIYILLICSVSPIYYANRYAIMFSPERNKTILGLVYTDDRVIVEQITNAITNIGIPFVAYIMIISCTATLVIQLRKKLVWRMKNASYAKADLTSERDQKVSRMVVMISALFIACLIPLCFAFTAMVAEPRISVDGQYKNMQTVIIGLSLILEATNSSANIFIYYRMSSKYRVVFRNLLSLGEKCSSVQSMQG